MNIMRIVLRIVIPTSCFVGSLYLLDLMAYHIWLSGGPPNPYPKWHLYWGNIFAALGLSCALLGILFIRLLRGPKKGKMSANSNAHEMR